MLPGFYTTPQKLQKKVDEYFKKTPIQDQTIAGLTLFLGFSTRKSLFDYNKRDGFSEIIKIAKLRIEYSYEVYLKHSTNTPTGPIFALKAMGWNDGDNKEHSTTIIVKDKDKDIIDRVLNK